MTRRRHAVAGTRQPVKAAAFQETAQRPTTHLLPMIRSHTEGRKDMTCQPPTAVPVPAARGRRGCGALAFGGRAPRGFTLLELLIAVAIVAVLAVLAASQYAAYVERVKVGNAKADILAMELAVQRFHTQTFRYPASLAEIGLDAKLDPWQRPYHYTDLSGKGAKGKARKDHKLNPLNSDFDLFSAGKDGVFKTQVDQKDSLDDVIRARDGSFVDLARNF
jgi:general secretion pathway protein G